MAIFDKILPITEVKKDLLSIVKKIQNLGGSIAITKNGKPVAVLMSLEEYEGLMETLEILSDTELMKILNQSRAEWEQGKLISHEDVWRETQTRKT